MWIWLERALFQHTSCGISGLLVDISPVSNFPSSFQTSWTLIWATSARFSAMKKDVKSMHCIDSLTMRTEMKWDTDNFRWENDARGKSSLNSATISVLRWQRWNHTTRPDFGNILLTYWRTFVWKMYCFRSPHNTTKASNSIQKSRNERDMLQQCPVFDLAENLNHKKTIQSLDTFAQLTLNQTSTGKTSSAFSILGFTEIWDTVRVAKSSLHASLVLDRYGGTC